MKNVLGIELMLIWAAICVTFISEIYDYLKPFFTGRHPFSGVYSQTVFGLETRLLCYIISAVMILAIVMTVPNRKIPFLTKLGERTLSVYFWHRPIIVCLDTFGVLDYCFSLSHGWILVVFIAVAMTVILGTEYCYRPIRWLKNMVIRKQE